MLDIDINYSGLIPYENSMNNDSGALIKYIFIENMLKSVYNVIISIWDRHSKYLIFTPWFILFYLI